jgi:tryptophan 2,3-dioxygenase
MDGDQVMTYDDYLADQRVEAERIIGFRRGTGGTAGAAYLAGALAAYRPCPAP